MEPHIGAILKESLDEHRELFLDMLQLCFDLTSYVDHSKGMMTAH